MMAYFLRAKSQLHCKMGPGFVHNFQEMTYLKPTFCEHCAGFVSLSSVVFSYTQLFVQRPKKVGKRHTKEKPLTASEQT